MVKKNIFYKVISFIMCLSIFFMASYGCDNRNKSDSGNASQDGTSENSGDKTQEYSYGENWLDVYDADYTTQLLAMSEQDFTISQLSSTFSSGSVKAKGVKKAGKYVGVFYFLWLGDSINGIYDISKMLESYTDPYNTTNALWANSGSSGYNASVSPQNAFHYFEEPLYGYYRSTDKWVIRKHLELLTMAGIDFLYLDFTNATTTSSTAMPSNIYKEATIALLDTILEMQGEGYDVPQIVPICCNPDTSSDTTQRAKIHTWVVQWVYNNYYAVDNFKYKSCWFTADSTKNPSGKPLLVTYSFDSQYLTNSAVANAFWMRTVVWPTQVTSSSYANGFPWMDYSFPQSNYGGIMNVSVAQHLDGSWSSEAYLARHNKKTSYKYRGRGATPAQTYAYQTDSVDAANMATNFVSEWNNVFNYNGEDDVWMVTVTGWNEWVAQKLNFGTGYATFVDTFNIAFSRDIEMMRDENGYGDTYFLQLAENVRKFKYGNSGKNSYAAMWKMQTIDYKSISAWDSVKAKYIDFSNETQNRNEKSIANKYTYTDESARNDIEYIKIANDSEYLYVLVKAKENITTYESGDTDWMNLWLTVNGTGWNGYDYVINRLPNGEVTAIEKLGTDSNGKITTNKVGYNANIYTEGQYITYRIPLKSIAVTSANEIGIKATDNIFANKATSTNDGVGCYSFGDMFAFYCSGDSAPAGRLNYTYRMGY